MKILKRVTAFFLMVVVVLAMSCTVSATETKLTEEQTIEQTDKQDKDLSNLSLHTYEVYQILSGTASEGTLIGVDWPEKSDDNNEIKAVSGAAFLDELNSEDAFKNDNDKPFAGIEYNENDSKKSADDVAKILTKWNNSPESYGAYVREFARIAHEYIKENPGIKGIEVKPDGSENLPAGYYLVVDKEDFSGDNVVNAVRNLSFLQMITDGKLVRESKADIPVLSKEVYEINDSGSTVGDAWGKAANYDVGDVVNFRLTGTLPEDYDNYKEYKYVFHDTLSNALSLDVGTLVVKINENKLTKDSYSFSYDEGTTKTFSIVIEDLKKLSGVGEITKDTKIVVEYEAELGAEGIIYGEAGNKNTAYLEYSNDPNNDGEGTTGRTPKDEVIVLTYQLTINKIKEDESPLDGAGFSLYKFDKNTNKYEIYRPGDESGQGKFEVTTDIDGNDCYELNGTDVFEFKGLDAGKYKLVETKVPAGYNRADDLYFTVVAERNEDGKSITDLKVEFEDVTDVSGNVIKNIGASVFSFEINLQAGSLTTSIKNLSGLLLPATGGIGTTIFYVVGGILVVGAGVLLIAKKRSDKTKSE